jgi:uncharacterized protein DUF6220
MQVWSRRALVVVAWLLVGCTVGQIFLAGLGVFAGPQWWLRHKEFVDGFQYLAPLALVLTYLARTTRGPKVAAWLMVLLLWLQYTTIEQRLIPGHQVYAALHPVGGMLIFWLATELVRRTATARPV